MAQAMTCAVSGTGSSEFCSGKIRTVVVDDSDILLDAICTLLECTTQVEVVGRAADGAEALERVAELQPDLVVMDVNMPRLDGFQAARFLVQHFPNVKVVLMSATDSPKIREQCRESGVNFFASKITFRQDFSAAFHTLFHEAELSMV